ncbi:hypothetical protein B0H14DRAFT_2608857 [Mycena olivaceomarginata]|nr:hypothetical protein B0H14DRAFT_2608857 [Mycena olivaceomarginata]
MAANFRGSFLGWLASGEITSSFRCQLLSRSFSFWCRWLWASQRRLRWDSASLESLPGYHEPDKRTASASVKRDTHRGKKRIVHCIYQESADQQPMNFAKWKFFCIEMGEKWVNDDVGILADERLTLGARAYSKDFAKISAPMIKGTSKPLHGQPRQHIRRSLEASDRQTDMGNFIKRQAPTQPQFRGP